MHRVASAGKERELIIWGIPQTNRFISHKIFRAAQASSAFLRSTCQLHASLQFFVWMGSGLLAFSDHTRSV